MNKAQRSRNVWMLLRYALVALWVLFTLALTGWWGYFALRQLWMLAELNHEHAKTLTRYQHMLIWEGATLFLCLLGGGAALAYLTYRTRRESERNKEFFAAFTHELKTPLASIRLQAEVLQERLSDSMVREKLNRLLGDIGRLYLRLENSLFLAAENALSMVTEELRLKDILISLEGMYATLKVDLEADCLLHADRRALDVILGNILDNAVVHGQATEMKISATSVAPELVELCFRDNGRGSAIEAEKLGVLFLRSAASSGSGIGLYLVRLLSESQGGGASYSGTSESFQVLLQLRGRVL